MSILLLSNANAQFVKNYPSMIAEGIYFHKSLNEAKTETVSNKFICQSRVQGPHEKFGNSSILHEQLSGTYTTGPAIKSSAYSDPSKLAPTYPVLSMTSTPLINGCELIAGVVNVASVTENLLYQVPGQDKTYTSFKNDLIVDSDFYPYRRRGSGYYPIDVVVNINRLRGYVTSNPSQVVEYGGLIAKVMYMGTYGSYATVESKTYDYYGLEQKFPSSLVMSCSNEELLGLLRPIILGLISSMPFVSSSIPLHPVYLKDSIHGAIPTVGSVRRLFRMARAQYALEISEPLSDQDWGELCYTAIKDCKYTNANLFAFMQDIPKVLDELKAAIELTKNPKNLKSWTGLYLSILYGTRLTISDLKDICKGVSRRYSEWAKSYSTVRARSTESLKWSYGQGRRRLNYKIYYTPYDSRMLETIKTLMDWDIWIDFQNAWDMIPLSFVVDWVANVESFLADMDALNYAYYLTVQQVIRTTKDVLPVSEMAAGCGLFAQGATFTRYNRELHSVLNLPVPRLGLKPFDLSHAPTLGAIIVQISKKRK